MTSTTYMPASDSGKADFLDHLAINLPIYSTQLNIAADDIVTLTADAKSFRYALQIVIGLQAYAQSWTAYKNQLRDGMGIAIPWPVALALPTPIPAVVKQGVITRLSSLVASIKANKNYSTSIGKDLWLIGSEVVVDPVTWKPVITVQFQAGRPTVQWTKGQAAAIEIWVDRNDTKGFVLMAINIEPNTTDSHVLPEADSSVVWHYKAIYLLHDVQVGQWSDIISVSVG